MAMTKLTNLINPQVMADIIKAKLPSKIKLAALCKIDDSLTATPGSTITVPKYAYIGDAEDVAEGVAMGTTVLTATTQTATVKKAGKAIEISDESVLSGYGNPMGNGTMQLTQSIAGKVDTDVLAALGSATLEHDDSSNFISYAGVIDAIDKFEDEEDGIKVLLIHPKQKTTIRKDANFLRATELGDRMILTGAIGSIGGCQVVASKRIKESSGVYEDYIVKVDPNIGEDEDHAVTIYMKKDVDTESDRDILKKTTVISADEYYTVALTDESKVIKYKCK